MSVKTMYGVVAVTIVGILFAGVAYNQGWFKTAAPAPVADNKPSSVIAQEQAPDGFEWVGGVRRAKTDIEERAPLDLPVIGEEAIGRRMGRSPALQPVTNASTQSVAEALAKPNERPERLSTLFTPRPFNRELFEQDPQTYLSTIEPGRVWQSLAKADGVPEIRRQSPLYQTLIQGESVPLRVQVTSNGVATFHSFDLGHFDNGLTTMSVQAGEDGIASVNFTASGGTFGELNILAASPLNSGQVNFVVKVSLPAIAAVAQ